MARDTQGHLLGFPRTPFTVAENLLFYRQSQACVVFPRTLSVLRIDWREGESVYAFRAL